MHKYSLSPGFFLFLVPSFLADDCSVVVSISEDDFGPSLSGLLNDTTKNSCNF